MIISMRNVTVRGAASAALGVITSPFPSAIVTCSEGTVKIIHRINARSQPLNQTELAQSQSRTERHARLLYSQCGLIVHFFQFRGAAAQSDEVSPSA